MKRLFLLFALAPLAFFAQKKDIQKTSFLKLMAFVECVKHVLKKQPLGLRELKIASWDIPTHQFTILYDANSKFLENVHQAIAAAGHDTPLATAPDEVYENLPMCCLYDRKKKKNKKSDPRVTFSFYC